MVIGYALFCFFQNQTDNANTKGLSEVENNEYSVSRLILSLFNVIIRLM
jgi:hypothetical protein